MNDYAVIFSTWLAVASLTALRRLWAGLGKGQTCDALQGRTGPRKGTTEAIFRNTTKDDPST
jgi:hypothetical protein